MHNILPQYIANLTILDKDERDMLVMSTRPDGQVLSRYGDNIWDFWPYIYTNNVHDCHKKIDFHYRIQDNQFLTAPIYKELLESARALLYVRLCHKHPRNGLTLSHSGLIHKWKHLRLLLQWMVINGYSRLADLTPAICMTYVYELKSQKLSNGTMQIRFSVLEDLYLFRSHLDDALKSHPWQKASAYYLSKVGNKAQQNNGKTEMIPERLTKKLAQGVLRYVESGYGDQLLACRDAYNAIEGNTVKKYKAIKKQLQLLNLKSWAEVKKEIKQLYTSCYVGINLFGGLRDSEMSSLEIGCYTEHEGWDGAIYGWINGFTYKLNKNPKSAEWMVPPVVKKAVVIAERVSAPLRDNIEKQISQLEMKLQLDYVNEKSHMKDVDTLQKLKLYRRLLFLGEATRNDTSAPWSNQLTNIRLKALAKHLDLQVEAEDHVQVMARDLINVGDLWPLASHQFRKTFAVFVARNTFGDVLYLRQYFKHWSLDMTLYYAAADFEYIDDTLLEDIINERDELQAIIVEGWLKMDRPLTGEGAVRVKEYRQRSEVRAANDHRDLARKLSAGFYIRGTGHSWCTAEKCKGLGIYDVLECKDCDNRLIDQSHLPVWRGIRNQQIELLEMDDLGDPMWQRAKNHLRYAEKILQELGEKVDPYPVPSIPSEIRKSLTS